VNQVISDELGLHPSVINLAGKALASTRDGSDLADETLDVVAKWRSAHRFPLNTMKLWLVNKARQIDEDALVAQRLKRMSSIASKLSCHPTMKLTQMQDIAGCRAIVGSVNSVYAIAKAYGLSDIRHERVHVDDYIGHPKVSGYRSIHLVYRYRSDKKTTFNGLKVEVQLRSMSQHAWATAVETVGIFTKQALKSSQGERSWLRFFALMGDAMARRERTPGVPGMPDDPVLVREELRDLTHALDVEGHLKIFAEALKTPEKISTKDAHYFLLSLDPSAMKITVTGYKRDQLERADSAYLAAEKKAIERSARLDTVLVSVDTFALLKKAYPNYFLDTHRFIPAVNREIRPTSRRDNPAQRILPFPYFPLSYRQRQWNKLRSTKTGRFV
jgi:hypothetical protein